MKRMTWNGLIQRASIWLAGGFLVIAGATWAGHLAGLVRAPAWLLIYFALVLPASLACFVVNGWDKRAARLKQWRVSERTLHGLELAGGWPGALLAQKYFRHKTVKASYRLQFWAIVCVHLAVLVYGLTR